MASSKGIKVAKCPIGREYCFPSCYWREKNRCLYHSKEGRAIQELVEEQLQGLSC